MEAGAMIYRIRAVTIAGVDTKIIERQTYLQSVEQQFLQHYVPYIQDRNIRFNHHFMFSLRWKGRIVFFLVRQRIVTVSVSR